MGGVARFLMLLSAPFPRLYPRPSALRLPSIPLAPLAAARHRAAPALYHTSRPRLNYAARAAGQLHTHITARDDRADPLAGTRASHRPWPEWSELVDHLSATGYSNRPASPSPGDDDDSFAVQEGLPEEFVTAAGACLSFARDRPDVLRLLSKKDLEVVVQNGSPFLFKNGANSAGRMRLFLGGNESNSPVSDRANTVDVMRYLLSYAHNLLNMSGGEDTIKTRESLDVSVCNLLNELVNVSQSGRESTLTDMTGRQVSIRQDQFSRAPMQNIEMKRGDWICPKCNFMNFARNMSCLQCAEGRPKRQLTGGEWECPQCDFFNYGRNMSCLRCDCRRPGETPLSTATPSTARLGQNEKSSFESSISQSLDRILSRSSPSSGNTVSRDRSNPLENRQSMVNQRREGGSVPFVPLPPDMFRKSQETKNDTRKLSDQQDLVADGGRQSSFLASGSFESGNPFTEKTKNPSENKKHKEELDKSETFFKKVSELDDSTNLATGISDDDFPEIMPMRKGENRFVISKKKDRSLTSPQYKRRMAMEQANSNFVPFVPFPPDYFAKKGKQSEAGSPAESSSETSSPLQTNQSTSGTSSESKSMFSDRTAAGNVSQQPEITHTNTPKYNPDVSWSSSTNNVYGGASRTSSHLSKNFSNNSRDNWNDKAQNNAFDSTSASNSSSQQPGNSHYMRDDQNRGFTGKSLEGSAVTEPDPLDMSEEAKAQRWFRRVAQIKDISELANIPDEDFPEIMPLRKGVNRFVVSKRKTPLERRLTSQQYRRNLPIVSSEPDKERNSE